MKMLLSFLFSALSLSAFATGPSIQFESESIDLGLVKDSRVQISFTYTNTGDQDLKVIQVQPSCGCTAVSGWSTNVAPGATGNISVVFNTTNVTGTFQRVVTMACNDTNHPAVLLKFHGEIFQPFVVRPAQAIIPFAPGMTNASITLTITNQTSEAIELVSAEPNVPQLRTVLRPIVPGRSFELIVGTTANSVSAAKVFIQTTSKAKPQIEVPVWVYTLPATAVIPK